MSDLPIKPLCAIKILEDEVTRLLNLDFKGEEVYESQGMQLVAGLRTGVIILQKAGFIKVDSQNELATEPVQLELPLEDKVSLGMHKAIKVAP